MNGRKSRKTKLAEVASEKNWIPSVFFFYTSSLLRLLVSCKLMKSSIREAKPQPKHYICIWKTAKQITCRTIKTMFFSFNGTFTAMTFSVLKSCFAYFHLLCLCLRQVWSIAAGDKKYRPVFLTVCAEHWQVQLWKNAHGISFWRGIIFLVLKTQINSE